MLIEVEYEKRPQLWEVREAKSVERWGGKPTGRTLLTQGSHASRNQVEIDLTYEEFRWAYGRSVKAGEPFLSLIGDAVLKIKSDYERELSKGPSPDSFPYRPR